MIPHEKSTRLPYAAYFLVSVLLLLTSGCAPDLVVEDLNVTWTAAEKKADATIANVGTKDAGEFMVYFNADESPESQNHRPQVNHHVPGLRKGESIDLSADFTPLAHTDNNHLGNVYQITVLADPKDMVKELNENNNTKSIPLQGGGVCMDFGPPPSAGTVFGSPANNPGDIVMQTASGIRMSVYDFVWVGGGGTFNTARIELPPRPFGNGQTIRTNNINLDFNFAGIGFLASRVTLEFLDMGGFENLSVNGQPVPIYAGELTAVPNSIAGVSISVASTPLSGGKKGTVALTGPVNTLRVGGQELWLDNVCAWQ
jgi:hypothetical protein